VEEKRQPGDQALMNTFGVANQQTHTTFGRQESAKKMRY
jgi:hypothetical protein